MLVATDCVDGAKVAFWEIAQPFPPRMLKSGFNQISEHCKSFNVFVNAPATHYRSRLATKGQRNEYSSELTFES